VRRVLRDYALSIVLAALFSVSWLLQGLTGWVEFAGDASAHGQGASLFGADGYVWSWMAATFENWQSEFLQLFTFVVLTTFLIHRKSHESPDSDHQMQSQLNRIEKAVKELQEGKQA
jgi:hypothetical protein